MASLLEPHASLTDPEDRRRSRLLGIAVLVLTTLFAFVDLGLSLSVPGYHPPWFGYGLMAMTFALNRSGRYSLAAVLAVAMFPVVAFGVVYSGGAELAWLSFSYLALAPTIAAIFLPIWGVATLSLANVCGIALAPLLGPEIPQIPQIIGSLSLNVMAGALAVLYMHHRNGLEADRGRALADREERLRLSLDAAQMGTFELDCGSRKLSLDERAATLLGDPIAGVPSVLERLLPDDGAMLRDALEAAAAGTQPAFTLCVQLRASTPEPRWLELTGRAALDASGGGVQRVLGTLVEISNRRRLEERLRQAQRMEALGRMSGGIAHDFNNVLTVVLMSAARLRLRAPAPELDDIDNAARSAASLTRKLLTFSRGAVLAPRVLDLDEVVRGATGMIARLIGEDISIRYRPPSQRWLTRIDANQLEQVLFNLAANARDAMPAGGTLGVELDCVTLSAPLLADSSVAGDYVRLRVSDTGHGMDDQTRRHIFEPFFTTKERGKGTGLGLAMVFGSVSQSGGFIETQSTPGQGTRFDLYFPRARQNQARPRNPTPVSPRGSETLLLVEDDASVRKVTSLLLKDAGYLVLSAASVAEARRLFAERMPEIALVVTDEVMPGGRGSDLVAELRRERPDLPALCTTGYIEPSAVPSATSLELPTLQKPFERELLLRRVRALIDEPPPKPAASAAEL